MLTFEQKLHEKLQLAGRPKALQPFWHWADGWPLSTGFLTSAPSLPCARLASALPPSPHWPPCSPLAPCSYLNQTTFPRFSICQDNQNGQKPMILKTVSSEAFVDSELNQEFVCFLPAVPENAVAHRGSDRGTSLAVLISAFRCSHFTCCISLYVCMSDLSPLSAMRSGLLRVWLVFLVTTLASQQTTSTASGRRGGRRNRLTAFSSFTL